MFHRPAQFIPSFPPAALRVVDGANLGDEIGIAEDILPDDVYHLTYGATQDRLAVRLRGNGALVVDESTGTGTPGNALHLDSCVTFMAPDGSTADCLIAAEVDDEGMLATVHVLPLDTLQSKCDYRVIGVDRAAAARKFGEIGAVSFTRGTHITMASGAQRRIEELQPGDRVLTRDAGAQEIRWIGTSTQKANGAFAPILIKAGTLNNLNDLVVSPDHRLFIYQREDTLGAGRAEVLVRAQHLLNGTSVTKLNGGYIDYFQLLFDDHQIIYAEGIAAETMLVDGQTQAALPADMVQKAASEKIGRDTGMRAEYEVSETLLRHPDAAERLRRASTR